MFEKQWERFYEEGCYLRNWTPKTQRYYRQCWDTWGKLLTDPVDIKAVVIQLRKSKLATITINGKLRGLNAFLHWMGSESRADLLKEDRKPLVLFSPEQIHTLLSPPPRLVRESRVALALAVVSDTGLRADEVLSLRREDVDIHESLLRVQKGKGRKGREVPISSNLRKRLLPWVRQEGTWLFETRTGRPWSYRNSLRDLKLYCARQKVSGPRVSWHTIRHSFATNYIRQGGDVTMLQRILGHTTLTMTQRYLHLQTADLRRVHDRCTMLR
jgi:integrase/recombinase XerD